MYKVLTSLINHGFRIVSSARIRRNHFTESNTDIYGYIL